MGFLLIILLGAMLFFGALFSYLTRKWKPGGRFRTLFFLLGMTIPVIDALYKKIALAYYCSGYTDGIEVYMKFEPEGHFFVSSDREPVHLALGADYIEWLDLEKNELWKIRRDRLENDDVKKESIDKVTSKYEYVELRAGMDWREYPVPGITRSAGPRLLELSSRKIVVESYSYASTNSFGWFMGLLYEGFNWGCSRTDAVSNNREMRFRKFVLGQDNFFNSKSQVTK